MADLEQERVCQICNYSTEICARGLGFSQLSLTISRRFKCTMMTPTGEWYEFEVGKRGRKYYLTGEWEMFASIYRIKHGDKLHFSVGSLVHEHLVVGHVRRLSGDVAMPRCTIAEYKAEQ
ncbi:hypothetical protein VPH35_093040 [Triticum aestivum]